MVSHDAPVIQEITIKAVMTPLQTRRRGIVVFFDIPAGWSRVFVRVVAQDGDELWRVTVLDSLEGKLCASAREQ